MKNQVLFSSKNKSKKLKCCLLQFFFGTLRVNPSNLTHNYVSEYWLVVTDDMDLVPGRGAYMHS